MQKNIILLVFVQISNYIFPLLTLPYLISVLGPKNFGLLVMAQAWIQYAIIFSDYGFNLSATRVIAISVGNKTEINKIYTKTMAAKFVLVLLSYFVLFCYGVYCEFNSFFMLIFISSISLIGSLLFPVWLFQGLEKMDGIVWSSTLAKTLAIILTFFLVKNENDLLYAAFVQSLGLFLSGVISCIYIYAYNMARITNISFLEIRESLKNGFDLFVSNLFISIYTTINVLIVGFFLNSSVAGFFSAADKLRCAAQGFLSPVQQALFPRVSFFVNRGMDLKEMLIKYGYGFILLGFSVSIGIALIGYPLSPLYFGDGYESASLMLLMMSPIPFIVSIGIVFGQWWLIACNKSIIIRKIYMYVGFLHIITCVVSIKYIGEFGVILAQTLTECIASLLFVFISVNRSNNHA